MWTQWFRREPGYTTDIDAAEDVTLKPRRRLFVPSELSANKSQENTTSRKDDGNVGSLKENRMQSQTKNRRGGAG